MSYAHMSGTAIKKIDLFQSGGKPQLLIAKMLSGKAQGGVICFMTLRLEISDYNTNTKYAISCPQIISSTMANGDATLMSSNCAGSEIKKTKTTKHTTIQLKTKTTAPEAE